MSRAGMPGGAHEADKQRIEIGALAAEIAGLEHGGDVADAAAAHLGVAEGVLDDPFVDGVDLFDLGLLAGSDLVRRSP